MIRRVILPAVLVHALAMLARPAFACECVRFSTCNEVASTNLVFIGTVESIEPKFLSRWNDSSAPSLAALNSAYLQARDHPSAGSLAQLKAAYLRAFPDASADRRKQLQSAATAANVAALFYSNLGHGMQVRLRVQTLFKHQDDDDDDDDDRKKGAGASPKQAAHKAPAEEPEPDFFDIWTPFGDCGINFQAGETYLVYASDDEETTDSIATDACTRTRRLSEAGEDLAYLYFLKAQPEAATRIDGYATTNARYHLNFDPQRPETIQPVVRNAVVALEGARPTRFTETDETGHFVFDGLKEGGYQLRAYTGEYPRDVHALANPPPFHLKAKSCSLQILVLSKDEGTGTGQK